MNLQASCVWPLAATLGEGPVWSVRDQCLWFVDIKRHRLHRHVPGQDGGQTWALPGQGGFALPARSGELVIGLPGELRAFDPRSGLSRLLQRLEEDRPGNRLNDGHVDAAGRLWFGSMDDAETALSGALYAWHSGRLTRHDDGICITNGPVTSPDGRTLYHTDTVNREIHAFDLAADGTTSGKRLFLRFGDGHGWPDGSTVDAEGCLWVAFFGGWGVRRYAPDGTLLTVVDLPCANVTKLAFGGPDLRTAYVTTARKGLDEAALAAQPLAGGLFAFTAPVAGLPSTELVLPA
jgi:sugar lactone lactonase YvrE